MKKIKLCMVGLIVVLVSTQIVAISSNMSSYDPWLDLNDDGIIDAIDLQILAWMYGSSGTPINKTALLLDLQERVDSLNASLLTDYYNKSECDGSFALSAHTHDWSDIADMPPGFADGIDDDTTYSAGTGLSLTATTFSVQADSITSEMITDGTITGSDISTSASLSIAGLNVDSGTLYVDNINDRVGIGTMNPSGPLHVGETISDYQPGFANTGAVITSVGVDHAAPRTNVLKLMRDGTPYQVFAGAADFDLSKWSASGTGPHTQLDIRLLHTGDAGGVYTDVLSLRSNGNVGIGTTTPAYRLDVEGYVQAYGYYTGDIIFQSQGENLWRMFEDEKGLYLENLKDSKVYSFVLQDAESGELLELSGTHLSITEGVVGFVVALGLVFGINKYKAKNSKEELDPQQTTLSQWQ